MTKTILSFGADTGGGNTATTASSTQYCPLGHGHFMTFVDVSLIITRQVKFHIGGTLSSLFVNITANSVTGGASTITANANGSNTSISVSIGAGSTGLFEDTAHTHVVANNDLMAYELVTNSGGTMFPQTISVLFEANNNKAVIVGFGSNVSLATASQTRYFSPWGRYFASLTERNMQITNRTPSSLKNLYVYVATNARTTNTTYTTRVNIAVPATPLTFVIAATDDNVTKEDLANTVSLADGDEFNFRFNTGTGTGTLPIEIQKVDWVSDSRKFYLGGIGGAANTNFGATHYFSFCGVTSGSIQTSEPTAQTKTRMAVKVNLLQINVYTNTLSGGSNSTYRFRKNAANGNQTISITNGVSGIFEDSTNTDNVAPDDLISVEVVAGGTSGLIGTIGAGAWAEESLPTPVMSEQQQSQQAMQIVSSIHKSKPVWC